MDKIVFKINGKEYKVGGEYPIDFTLNEFIRTVVDLRGTKVMCRQGGCGACIVTVKASTPPTNEIKTFAVNSCLVSIFSCHGWEIITVEGIGNKRIGYHEIQKRLAKFNGTQCGFCSPGWVMSMYSLYESKGKLVTSAEIENSFASNICRCTGYRSIADAFKSLATDPSSDIKQKVIDLEDIANTCRKSNKCEDEVCENGWCVIGSDTNVKIEIDCDGHKWFRVKTLDDIFKAMKNGDYRLVAGNTGQGVYSYENDATNLIDITNVADLRGYDQEVNLILKAAMTLTEMMGVFLQLSEVNEDFSYLKQFWRHLDLVAHIPVRNTGTLAGNLYMKHTHPSFPSDLFLLFETVGGMITIAEGVGKNRIMSFPDFMQYDMNKKVIVNVLLPPLSTCCLVKTYKIMSRSQNAHAIVNAGFMFQLHRNSQILEKATIVYGGISHTFIHASKTEQALVAKDLFTNETLELALKSLSEEVNPEIIEPEPSVGYRKMLAVSLFYKAILSLCPQDKMNPVYKSGGDVIKREVSKGSQYYDSDQSVWPLNKPVPKIEAILQCSGELVYANALRKQTNEVYAAFVTADVTPGSIINDFDTTEAFKLPGVTAFYTPKDIPGENTFTPKNVPLIMIEEEILCSGKVMFHGQPASIIVASREKTALKAAKLVKINYKTINKNRPLLSVDDVMNSPEKSTRIIKNQTIEPTDLGNDVKKQIKGEFKMADQYHFYIEPQTCIAKPTDDGMEVYSSTQWLDLTNIAVAQTLNVPVNSINVIVQKVGGAYGGKITRATQVACAAALVAHLQGNTCRMILPLQVNMKSIGKRLPTQNSFEVGVDDNGLIQYLKNTFYQDKGHSINEILFPLTIAHSFSCYDTKRWGIEANTVLTDKPSNTWCRGPGSTEGVAMIENIMEKIAFDTGKDPTQVRIANMAKENNPLIDMIAQLKTDSDYNSRLQKATAFNEQNRWRKRAIKILPMRYNVTYFGNYNSIVSIYHGDGSVVIMHGGIEMGQGLNTKVAQVCAYTLGVPLEKISVKASTSFTSPNTMTTGGSIGSECVSFATKKACDILLDRLAPIKGKGDMPWEDLITEAFKKEIDLQATYMYSAINDDVKPYHIYAVCALEVEVDILTGNHNIIRVDLLEDTGRSLSPLIDITQMEGAFVMGLGYWTSEKLVYDTNNGRLLTDGTWTYKPPGLKDIPADMRIYFSKNSRNEFGVLQSKATGEPALCLATIVIHALREAVRSARLNAGYPDQWFQIENPCTVENIFMAVGHKIEHFKLK
ncbi:xanthine dehydrogenase/oxidase-like [Pieris brassicae]|uniref:xanthine dehydrogenase/oxidase-like n=1 Tax=Pieris brassicae TaxID=7116 RepID=UPI001E65FCEC|nr:xanthine dehydrogenase/oxidase-like [Pieris brassicae]